jgi:hypothetical protein
LNGISLDSGGIESIAAVLVGLRLAAAANAPRATLRSGRRAC